MTLVASAAMAMTDSRSLGTEEGRYRKTAKLGEGTYGVVYRAFDTHRSEFVALKKVHAHACAGWAIPSSVVCADSCRQ